MVLVTPALVQYYGQNYNNNGVNLLLVLVLYFFISLETVPS